MVRRGIVSVESEIVAVLRTQQIDAKEIEAALDRAVTGLAPEVVYIRYSLEDDWSGDPAIYFRVLLSNDAIPDKRHWNAYKEALSKLTKRIRTKVLDEVKPDDWGLLSYFRFRTVSEQEKLNNPDWD